MCRWSGMEVENITHIISACGLIVQKENKHRYDKMTPTICIGAYTRSMKLNRNFTVTNQRWSKNDQIKILWDFNIQTDRILDATKPGNTIAEENKKKNKKTKKYKKMPSHRCSCSWWP